MESSITPSAAQYDFKPAFERLKAIMEIENFKSDYDHTLASYYQYGWVETMSTINSEEIL